MVTEKALQPIKGDSTVLILLENDQYGYGYTYRSSSDEEKIHRSACYQSRFTKEEMLDETVFDWSLEESKLYIGRHDSMVEAVNEILDFWLMKKKVIRIEATLTMAEAIQIGNDNGCDVVIFQEVIKEGDTPKGGNTK